MATIELLLSVTMILALASPARCCHLLSYLHIHVWSIIFKLREPPSSDAPPCDANNLEGAEVFPYHHCYRCCRSLTDKRSCCFLFLEANGCAAKKVKSRLLQISKISYQSFPMIVSPFYECRPLINRSTLLYWWFRKTYKYE